jgi:hypothetical protein
MTTKISWNNIPDSDKRILSTICPECQCIMKEYELLYGWQKCQCCGYTRENPADSDNGGEHFNLVEKIKKFKNW